MSSDTSSKCFLGGLVVLSIAAVAVFAYVLVTTQMCPAAAKPKAIKAAAAASSAAATAASAQRRPARSPDGGADLLRPPGTVVYQDTLSMPEMIQANRKVTTPAVISRPGLLSADEVKGAGDDTFMNRLQGQSNSAAAAAAVGLRRQRGLHGQKSAQDGLMDAFLSAEKPCVGSDCPPEQRQQWRHSTSVHPQINRLRGR